MAVIRTKVVDTIHGKHHDYDIEKVFVTSGYPKFNVLKNGKFHRGPFQTLEAAANEAKKEG